MTGLFIAAAPSGQAQRAVVDLLEELTAALREVSSRSVTRAVVIDGAGPAFSAGHDLSEMIGRDEAVFAELFGACTVMTEMIHEPVAVCYRAVGRFTQVKRPAG